MATSEILPRPADVTVYQQALATPPSPAGNITDSTKERAMDITRHGDWGKVQVKRWEGYGKVRAYVTVEGPRKPYQAGYIDLKTGEYVQADATWTNKAFATLGMSVEDICQHYGK